MDTIKKTFVEIVGETRVRMQELMSAHTTIKIGGPADFYVDAMTMDELEKLVAAARKMNLPVTIIGGGTNSIVSEKGIRGLVIKNNCRKIDMMGMKGTVKNNAISMEHALVSAESGTITNLLVRFTIDQGLSGLEYALGLPGTIGGAISVNANFPKKDILIGESLKSARIITKEGDVKEVDRDYFRFDFDYSDVSKSGDIILSLVFQMTPVNKAVLWDRGNGAVTYRTETQPRNIIGGVTFRNMRMSSPVHNDSGDNPSLQQLIEKAGLKNVTVGGASLSEINPRYIINTGNATTEDILALMQKVKERMYDTYGAIFHFDVTVLGEL